MDTSERGTLYRRMRVLHDNAYQAYMDGRSMYAAEVFGQALSIAESLKDPLMEVRYRFWRGAALNAAEKLRMALTTLMPIMQEGIGAGDKADVFNALCCYLEIAQSLPVRLSSIQSATEQAAHFLRDTGHLDWGHKLLLLRSELALARGQLPEALDAAQESWVRWQGVYPYYIADAHLRALVVLNTWAGNYASVRHYLAVWEHEYNEFPRYREKNLLLARSNLARKEGDTSQALALARQAVVISSQSDEQFDLFETVLRAYLTAGEVAAGRGWLTEKCFYRYSDNQHFRYGFHLLCGDYHLACARYWGGLPPQDEEAPQPIHPPDTLYDRQKMRLALRRARWAFQKALRVGKRVDGLLECGWREAEVSERLRRVAHMEGIIG